MIAKKPSRKFSQKLFSGQTKNFEQYDLAEVSANKISSELGDFSNREKFSRRDVAILNNGVRHASYRIKLFLRSYDF